MAQQQRYLRQLSEFRLLMYFYGDVYDSWLDYYWRDLDLTTQGAHPNFLQWRWENILNTPWSNDMAK